MLTIRQLYAAAAIGRAKTEAAKSRLMYAEEEVRMKVEKGKLEAKMDQMVLERETAAAVAEAKALDAAVDNSESCNHELPLETTPVDVLQQTSEYVEQINVCDREQLALRADPLSLEEIIQPHTELPSSNSVAATCLKTESGSNDARFHHTLPSKVSAQPS